MDLQDASTPAPLLPAAERALIEERGGAGAAVYGELTPAGRAGSSRPSRQGGTTSSRSGLRRRAARAPGRGGDSGPRGHRDRALGDAAPARTRGAVGPTDARVRERVTLVEGDVLRSDLGATTLVWIGSTAFGDELLGAMARRCLACPRAAAARERAAASVRLGAPLLGCRRTRRRHVLFAAGQGVGLRATRRARAPFREVGTELRQAAASVPPERGRS